jgi:hypothetical protein
VRAQVDQVVQSTLEAKPVCPHRRSLVVRAACGGDGGGPEPQLAAAGTGLVPAPAALGATQHADATTLLPMRPRRASGCEAPWIQ